MYKVFEMNQSSNFDDPAKIIEVQQKVRELLEANRFRQDEIKKEMAELGPWAVPGLVNSLYVYMHLFKDNSDAQLMIADLISAQAQDNNAAAELIFRTGVVESPFAVSRNVALRALETLEWKPNKEQISLVKSRIKEAQRLGDQIKEVDLNRLLAISGDDQELPGLMEVYRRLMTDQHEFGGMLAMLVQKYPQKAKMIVIDVLQTAEQLYTKDKNIADHIAKALGPISADQRWLETDMMLEVSQEVLTKKNSGSKSHKSLEFVWNEVVKSSKFDNSLQKREFFNTFGQKVQQAGKNIRSEDARFTIYRYWFEAAGRSGGVDYICDEAFAPDDEWGFFAVVQLFFLEERNSELGNTLQKLKSSRPQRWNNANDLFIRIKSGKPMPSGRELHVLSGGGGISKH